MVRPSVAVLAPRSLEDSGSIPNGGRDTELGRRHASVAEHPPGTGSQADAGGLTVTLPSPTTPPQLTRRLVATAAANRVGSPGAVDMGVAARVRVGQFPR